MTRRLRITLTVLLVVSLALNLHLYLRWYRTDHDLAVLQNKTLDDVAMWMAGTRRALERAEYYPTERSEFLCHARWHNAEGVLDTVVFFVPQDLSELLRGLRGAINSALAEVSSTYDGSLAGAIALSAETVWRSIRQFLSEPLPEGGLTMSNRKNNPEDYIRLARDVVTALKEAGVWPLLVAHGGTFWGLERFDAGGDGE